MPAYYLVINRIVGVLRLFSSEVCFSFASKSEGTDALQDFFRPNFRAGRFDAVRGLWGDERWLVEGQDCCAEDPAGKLRPRYLHTS